MTVTYGGGGSGKGQTDLAVGPRAVGRDGQPRQGRGQVHVQGPFLYFPTVAAPITVSYNLSGVSELKLSPDTLAKIFDGKITKWDDPAIDADNSGVDPPVDRDHRCAPQ